MLFNPLDADIGHGLDDVRKLRRLEVTPKRIVFGNRVAERYRRTRPTS